MNPTERDLLGPLDPARRDAPPARGSARYTAILETAMTQTDTRPVTTATPLRPRRWLLAGVPLAAAAAVAIAVATQGTGASPVTPATTPTQLVLAAARTTGDADTLRATVRITDSSGTRTATGEFDGKDAVVRDTDGGDTVVTTYTGDRVYTTENGTTTSVPRTGEDELEPFAASAAAVVEAAVTGTAAQELGTDSVAGTEATHYRVDLTARTRAALTDLGAGKLAWFDLEDPDQATGVDVWVADGLIRRIDVAGSRGPGSSASTEFSDFGAAITVTAP